MKPSEKLELRLRIKTMIKSLSLTDAFAKFCALNEAVCRNLSLEGCALTYTATKGDLERLKLLCELDIVHDAKLMQNAFRLSAINGHLDCVKFLAELKDDDNNYLCDVAGSHNSPLGISASKGQAHVVEYLLGLKDSAGKLRCDLTACGHFALRFGVKHAKVAEILFEQYWGRKIDLLDRSNVKEQARIFQHEHFTKMMLFSDILSNNALRCRENTNPLQLPADVWKEVFKLAGTDVERPLNKAVLSRIIEAKLKKAAKESNWEKSAQGQIRKIAFT